MMLTDIARIRLINQQLSGSREETAKELVAWMGAMQAQDFGMVKWAVGVRLTGSTEKMVEKAIDSGEIIRTHLMRPTWHLVSSDDIRWMLELTAPQIKASLKSRHRELEITNAVLRKSNSLIFKALKGNNHLSREELVKMFDQYGIATGNNRASHLLLCAELDGIICSGATKDRKPTYALLEERVAKAKSIMRTEALEMLARRYFSSHGPATLQDFVWWSGLPVADARNALEMVRPEFAAGMIEKETYWMPHSRNGSNHNDTSVLLLPAYDEFIISYRDRSAVLSMQYNNRAVSSNGIFRPVILADGQAIGIWSRTSKNNKVQVETQFFKKPDRSTRTLVDSAVQSFSYFHAI
jgi:hypothetical protein